MTQSEASVNQSQVNRNHTVIVAPIDGIVTQRSVDVGQTVAASMQAPTLFVIAADLTEMQVNANIDEADVGRIRPGQQVTFRVDAYPTDNFIGTVTQIRLQPVVVQNVTTYGTVITVPNRELKLKPGMTANVKIEIAKRTNALRIPNAALRFRPTEEVFAALQQTPPPETRGIRRPRRRTVVVAINHLRANRRTGQQANKRVRRRVGLPPLLQRHQGSYGAAPSCPPPLASNQASYGAVAPAAASAAAKADRRACSNASRPCRPTSRSSSCRACSERGGDTAAFEAAMTPAAPAAVTQQRRRRDHRRRRSMRSSLPCHPSNRAGAHGCMSTTN